MPPWPPSKAGPGQPEGFPSCTIRTGAKTAPVRCVVPFDGLDAVAGGVGYLIDSMGMDQQKAAAASRLSMVVSRSGTAGPSGLTNWAGSGRRVAQHVEHEVVARVTVVAPPKWSIVDATRGSLQGERLLKIARSERLALWRPW